MCPRRSGRSIRAPTGAREGRCTSSSSAAGGWAASSPARSSRPGTASRSSTRTRARSAACPPTSRARQVVGFGFDRDHLAAAGHRPGRSFRFGDERRQLQHPVRPHRPRDVRHRARRRPHLRPAPRAHLPTPRHPDRRDRRVDHRPGAAPAAARARPATTGSTRPARSGWSSGRSRPRRSARSSRSSTGPGVFWITAVTRFGKAQIVTSDLDRPGRRRAGLRERHGRARRAAGAHRVGRRRLMRVAIAGAGNVGVFIANDLVDDGPRGADHRAEPRRRRAATPRPPKASSGSSPTRARSRRCARPGSNGATSSSPRPATTRTTS